LDSAYPINSRNLRIYDYLKKNNDIKVITWDRIGETKAVENNYIVFCRKANYGNKKEKLKNIPLYYKFIDQNIKKYNPDVVIASHWDMLLLSSIVKIKTKFKLIYENRDMVSSRSPKIKRILSLIERLALIKTDGMILASRFFKPHYKYFNKEKVIIENKVSNDMLKYERKSSDKFRISFIGSVRFYEILINLIEVCKEIPTIEVNIYGDGPDKIALEQYITKNKINNVKVHGKYSYKEIGKLYSITDLLWSVYPNTESSNKKYVIPNKYFESIYFGVPGVFPNNTKTGELVEDYNIGYTVDPISRKEIKKILNYASSNINDIDKKRTNLSNINESIHWSDDIMFIEKLI
jgi:Glycosyl transferases group 1